VESTGPASFLVQRQGSAATVDRSPEGVPVMRRAGVLVEGEIAALVDEGNQKFLVTPSGAKRPALAPDLDALHAFQEDLRNALGLVSLYNLSLGTTSDRHDYDRLQGRP